MSEQPLVSVVIPCYNHARFVKETIQSVIDQDYKNIELIVIDDGSNDDSINEIKKSIEICRQRFERFEFKHRANKGLCATLIEAMGWVRGDYVNMIASDDVMYSNKIAKQVSEMMRFRANKENIIGIYAGVEYINSVGESIKIRKGKPGVYDFKDVFLRRVFLPTPTALFNRESILKVGGFNANYKVEDLYIRLKLTKNEGNFYVMSEPLVKYRRHESNLSKQSDIMLEEVSKILNEYQNDPLYKMAESSSFLIQAHDYQLKNSILSARYLLKSIIAYPSVLFNVSVYKLLFKFLYNPNRRL